jgi:glycosyltransferase involved in cell wall biosynthesis
MGRRVEMGLIFYPRGGSAQVVRYLARALARVGWDTSLACGSLGQPGARTHAESFFAGLDLSVADYRPAVRAFEEGRDPIAEPQPMHPSYEDRAGVPDRILTSVSPELGKHLAEAWRPLLANAAGDGPEVLHLHHLTPIHEAAARELPGLPIVTHLHGTELKMIDRAERLAAGEELDGTRPGSWAHAAHWLAEMRRWARASDRLIVISPDDEQEAQRLLGVERDRITWVPNGVDLERFDRADPSPEERNARWREWLVDQPQGWSEGGEPGSVAYTEAGLEAFTDAATGEPAPVLLFVGRFTEVKRIPLLVRAYARARQGFERRAPLVIWGGFPGEWEGEHPHAVVEREGIEDVFFVGWRGHSELGAGLACADVMVMPSIAESFGQVFIEAMACGVPVIAANAAGPPSFINTDPERPNGWLVEPDDLDSLAEAMVEAVNDPAAREERARNGYEVTRRDYSWETLAERVAEVYEAAIRERS